MQPNKGPVCPWALDSFEAIVVKYLGMFYRYPSFLLHLKSLASGNFISRISAVAIRLASQC